MSKLIVISAPSGTGKTSLIKSLIKELMILAPQPLHIMKVPLEVDVGIGNNWDEAH